MWCMMCKDVADTQLVRLVSKDSIVKAMRLLASTTLLHVPSSVHEVSVSLYCAQCTLLELFCANDTCLILLQVEQLLEERKPFTEELDCHQPPMSFNAVLTGFRSDLCNWAESEEARLSVEQRKPEKIVAAV